MKFRCLFRGHVWIVGRVASDWARRTIKPRKRYHNQQCCHCGKEEWHADAAEEEAERFKVVQEMLHKTEKVAKLKPVDPKNRPLDPNAFP